VTAAPRGLERPRHRAGGLSRAADGVRDVVDGLDERRSLRLLSIGLAVVVYLRLVPAFPHLDAYGYWEAARWPDPYAYGLTGYLYSPAFLQVFAPLLALPWEAFYAMWLAMLVAVLLFMTGPTVGIVLLATVLLPARLSFFPLDVVRHYLASGNIFLLMSFAAVLAFRWPGTWTFPILTKVSPGVAGLWHVGRRDWRAVAQAAAVTGLVVAVSFVLAPAEWVSWLRLLVSNLGAPEPAFALQLLPPLPRIAIAAVLVLVAARVGFRWVVPVAAMIALPYIPDTGLIMLVGAVPLWLRRGWTRA
jgi:Glycosyltransferase family 87